MKILMILLVLVSIDFMLILGSVSVSNINPNGNTLINSNESMMNPYNDGNWGFNENYSEYLPADESSVTGTGDIFTDTYKTSKLWVKDGKAALNVMSILFFGPAVYLRAINLPSVVVFGVGVIWFLTTLIIIVSWIFGRNT